MQDLLGDGSITCRHDNGIAEVEEEFLHGSRRFIGHTLPEAIIQDCWANVITLKRLINMPGSATRKGFKTHYLLRGSIEIFTSCPLHIALA